MGMFPGAARSAALVLSGLSTVLLAGAEPETAKSIFTKRCAACHYYGKGIKVGPDLKGITQRRTRGWLLAFIRGSSRMIRSGDPTATKLFRQFNQGRMPDWTDLSLEQVGAILDYLKIDGPEQKEPDERDAITATSSEIKAGRALFHARIQSSHSNLACNACHSIRDPELANAGSLGPDLTGAYLKYRDKALTAFLKHPCLPTDSISSGGGYLTPQESFNLKAYLARTGRSANAETTPAGLGRLTEDVASSGTAPSTLPLISDFLLTGLPYLAAGLFVTGLALRWVAPRGRVGVSDTEVLQAQRPAWARWWWLAASVLVLGHLAGLLFPQEILRWNSAPIRLYLWEGAALAAGLAVVVGCAKVVWRFFATSNESFAGQTADATFLALLLVEVASGILTALRYRWASSWAAYTLTPYIRSLFRGKPETALASGIPFLAEMHVVVALLILAAFPFTTIAAKLVRVLNRGLSSISRPLAAWIELARTMLQRYDPSVWIWPEEEE